MNWNAWQATTECLESLFKSGYDRFDAVVCDNASHDDSVEHLIAWADGRRTVSTLAEEPVAALLRPPAPKPIPVGVQDADSSTDNSPVGARRLVILKSERNRGFAGGSNCGIRYALSSTYEYVWLLNNDTVVAPDALGELVCTMQRDPSLGQCGSTLRYYADPGQVQAMGGAYYHKVFGRTVNAKRQSQPEKPLSYIIGASMLIRRQVLESAGLLDESYFLYFEELDFALRAQKYGLGYAVNSIVFHHEGATSGTGRPGRHRAASSDYFLARSRVVFTKRYYPVWLLTVSLGTLAAASKRLLRGQWSNAVAIVQGLRDGLQGVVGPRE